MSPFDDKTPPEMPLRSAAQIGALIRERRQQLGFTQHDLATNVGVGRQWISEVENGKPRAELELILKTLAALGIQLTPIDSPTRPTSLLDLLPTPDEIVEAARYRKSSGGAR